MHVECYAFMARMATLLGPRRCVLEIGSRNVNGSVRQLFPVDPADNYVGIDIINGPGVDRIADGACYWEGQDFDTVICTEVLEHTPDAVGICRNAFDVLDRGGVFIVTAATDGRAAHSANGGQLAAGEYYSNVSEDRLRDYLKRFSVALIEMDRKACDIRALAIK